jgi:hypothetical protein
MDSKFSFLIYVGVKLLAYTGWCAWGIHVIGHRKPQLRTALGYGLLRLLLGVIFGVGILIVGGMMHMNTPRNPWPLYFAIYAPVRWIEWSIMTVALAAGRSQGNFLLGEDNPSRLWRLGGIVVSQLADIPMILSEDATGMLPVGRFLC